MWQLHVPLTPDDDHEEARELEQEVPGSEPEIGVSWQERANFVG